MADDYKSTGSNKGQHWRCGACCFHFTSKGRLYQILLLTKAVWGKNYYFYFGGDPGQGVQEKDVMANPDEHPGAAAQMLMALVKGMTLCRFIQDQHGRRARRRSSR